MAFTNKLIDLIGVLMTLMVLTLPSTVANIDCNGKPFHCVNSTHFMICVDLGSGVSSTIDNFILQCPPPTVCQENNKFECDFPVVTSTTEAPTAASTVTSVSEIETVTQPYDLTTSVPYEQYLDTTTTLSEDVLITHQTTVTESTIKLVTEFIQNNEVMIPQFKLNETIPSDVVQNDLTITTALPNSISSNTTGTPLRNVNVTIPETKFNSTVTEDILSTDVALNDLRTTPTLPNNISANDLGVSSAKIEEVNIVTHASITNSTLDQSIQRATESATNGKTLYTSNNTNLPSDTAETSPSLDSIQNNVTPINTSANITGIFNNTAENTNVMISGSKINLTKDSIENVTLPTNVQNLSVTIPSETSVTQNEYTLHSVTALSYDITDSTTESILYHETEILSNKQNNTKELMSTNSSAINISLNGTEETYTFKHVEQQPETTTYYNMSDYVKDLIPTATESSTVIIPNVTSATEIAQTEFTLLSNLNNAIITSNGSDTITELILSEMTKLTFNDTYLLSATLPIHTTDTNTESILDKVSETSPKVEVKSATTTLLPDQASVSTRDPGLIASELNLDSTLNKTTPMFQTDTVQNKNVLISNSSNNVMPEYVAETVTEVTKITEINPSVLQKDFTTTLNLISDNTDVTVKLAKSAMNYTSDTFTSSLDITQNDYTTPLPSISTYITNTTGNGSKTNYALNINNATNIAQNENALLLNLSSSTVLPEKAVTDTKSILIEDIETPSKKQSNRSTPLSEFTSPNPTELIPGLTENDNVLILGLETNVSETEIVNKSVNSVRNDTIPLPLDSNIVTDNTISWSILASERNMTLNETLPSLAEIATESMLEKVAETTPTISFNLVQDYITSYANNTTLPDKLVDIVTELPVTDVTEDIYAVTAEYNLTLSAHYLRNSANSSNSSHNLNETKVESKIIVPNDIQNPFAQIITDLSMETAHNHTANILILSVNEINKENSTTDVSPSSAEPVTESYNGTSTTSLVNDSKNETGLVINTTVLPLEINTISYRITSNASQSGTINNESNTIDNENILTTSSPNHLAESASTQNSETSTQQTVIRTDSYVESKILESDVGKPANVLATQSTPSSLSVDIVQSEITSNLTINPRTTTSNFVLTTTGKHTSVNTVEKETSDITALEYITSTFQTEPLIVRTTEVAETPSIDTGLLGENSITNPIVTESVRTSVTESYSQTNYIANVNADAKLKEHSSSAVNINVTAIKQTNSILLLNSSSEQLPSRVQPTTATVILSKSTPTQDTVNPTNILFNLPSALEQANLSVSVQQESYTEPSINTNYINQSTPPNEIPTVKDITIQNTNSLNHTFTSVNIMTSTAPKDFTQKINNTERQTHTLEITSQNKVLEKSNLTMGGQNVQSQNKDTITDRQRTTLLDILISTQSTPPQANYTAQYATANMDNLHAQPTFNYDFNNAVPVKVETATQIDVIDKPYLESNRSKGVILEEMLDLKRGKENKTISSLTLNVSKLSQPMEEKSQISNDTLTGLAPSVSLDQDSVALKQYTADNLTIRPSTEVWRATVVTDPNMDKAAVTSKQYIADNRTIRPTTKTWRGKVSTKVLTEDKVTSKQYSADTSTLSSLTELLQATVVTKPDIDQNKEISTQNSSDTPRIKIEPTETRGKITAISDSTKSASKPNEDKTILKQRVTNTSEDARLMIDLKLTTDAFKESLIKVTNGDGVEQIANKSNLDNLQSNHASTSKMEFINNSKHVITKTTDQVITKTSDSKLDKDIVMVHAVKTTNGWLIKNYLPTQIIGTNIGISPPLKMKGDRYPEEIESVEQSEVNEEQAEYEESLKEKHDEALEKKKDELNKMSPKMLKMSPNNEYVNFNIRDKLESTVEITTKKGEAGLNSHHKFLTNIEVQPALVSFTENYEPTKVTKNVNAIIKNSTVTNTLSKSFANTHTASTPVYVPAKRNYVCKINSRGKFPDNNDCRKFYICSGKLEPIEGLCPNNTVFSELRKQCTKNVSHCIRNNQFQCVREGRFSDYFNDNIYYICLKNNVSTFTRFKLQCLSGYHLNKTSVRCALNTEWSRSTSQQSISDVSNNSERIPSSRSEKLVIESSNFECNKEGKFPDPNNCRKYYVCSKKHGKSRYRLKRKKCDSDELFHKDKKKCVDADSYDCN